MGKLINGIWQNDMSFDLDQGGAYARPDSVYRDVVADDHNVFKPEPNRYHLYVSYACPWAHRALIFR